MGLQDLFITPIYIILLSFLAYMIRPYVTTPETRKYFLPALWVRFGGAIMVGLIYQFYYGGGDTFMYYNLGTRYIWEAFLDNPILAMKLITSDMNYSPEGFMYESKIYTFGDSASYFVVRVGGLFALITGNVYSSIAVLFAFLSFFGCWAFYFTFYRLYPNLSKYLAWGILFFPSIFFWGSGILKDTLTLSALGFLFFGLVDWLVFGKRVLLNIGIIVISIWIIYTVKIYIILSFLPAVFLWIFVLFQKRIKFGLIKYLLGPTVLIICLLGAYYGVKTIAEDSYRYSLDKIIITAEETAKWNYYVSTLEGGSGYSLGDFDFSINGLLSKSIPAIITTILRPSIFEARNPVMLLTALENALIFVLIMLSFNGWFKIRFAKEHILILSLVFCILFAFSTGITSYNFGALARYRIPMLPFLTSSLIIIYFRKRKGVYKQINTR